jgi:hypothetical protein
MEDAHSKRSPLIHCLPILSLKARRIIMAQVTGTPEVQGGVTPEKPQTPEEKMNVFEEVLYALVDRVEAVATDVAKLNKTVVKKSTQRFGTEHKPKAVKDTKTSHVYPSLFASGKALASEFGLDPLDPRVYYQIIKKDATRLVVLAEGDPEGIKAQEDARAEIARQVEEANKKAEAEEAAQAKAEADAKVKAEADAKANAAKGQGGKGAKK